MKKVFHILKNIKIGPLDAQQLNFVKKLEKNTTMFLTQMVVLYFSKKYSFRIKDINLLETDKDIAEIKEILIHWFIFQINLIQRLFQIQKNSKNA